MEKLFKLTYSPSDYWTSEIIMDTIPEEGHERALGRDEVDGFKLDVPKVEVYLKQIILWIRVLMVTILVLTLGTVMLWNFFPPTTKDVSDRVRNILLNAINSENIGGLLAEEHFSSTSTIPPHGNTPA